MPKKQRNGFDIPATFEFTDGVVKGCADLVKFVWVTSGRQQPGKGVEVMVQNRKMHFVAHGYKPDIG
jgi:hypothetical protein